MIHRVAVLGAGVMGAQIAAHCVNAGLATVLFDVAATEGEPNALVLKALEQLQKLKPSPLAMPHLAQAIVPANYQQHLALLTDCDLIIEAVSERLDVKTTLYQQIAAHIPPTAYVVSNTSGLSIQVLAHCLPDPLRPRFCGLHFFNPPRYMPLVELIPHAATQASMLDELESFLTTSLGKSVVRAKDTPNFIANRIGVFALLAMIHRALALNIPLEVVDALTGHAFGRAKSGVFRTLDIVGLDTFAQVVHTMQQALSDDPWRHYFQLPDFVKNVLEAGALGQKTGKGLYHKHGQQLSVYDIQQQNYRPAVKTPRADVLAILKIAEPAARLAALRASREPEAQLLWHALSDVFHYSAYHAETIADTVRDIDLAMRWGFAWRDGVFSLWQQAGWSAITEVLQQEIQQGQTLTSAPLPTWVNQPAVYQQGEAYAPAQRRFVGHASLAFYQRQYFLDSPWAEPFNEGQTLWQSEAVRLWTLDGAIAVLSFQPRHKLHAIDEAVLDGILTAVDYAQKHCQALVLWQRYGEHFSAGADLKMISQVYGQQGITGIKPIVEKFQRATQALRNSRVPTVAAVRGFVLGGACEIALHCTKIVAAFESYLGLVETGVGLLPAAGGCKILAQRAWQEARGGDPYPQVVRYFNQIAQAEVANNARDAQAKGYLQSSDVIVMHPREILFVALSQAKALVDSAYQPPLSAKFPVSGKAGIANIQMQLTNSREGGFITAYEYDIALQTAIVLCGGYIEAGSLVDEAWVLRLECEAFCHLLQQPQTQQRLQHMLATSQVLRN